jgi:hypothetical protein
MDFPGRGNHIKGQLSDHDRASAGVRGGVERIAVNLQDHFI